MNVLITLWIVFGVIFVLTIASLPLFRISGIKQNVLHRQTSAWLILMIISFSIALGTSIINVFSQSP